MYAPLYRCRRSRNISSHPERDGSLTAATWLEGFHIDLQRFGLEKHLGGVLPGKPSPGPTCPFLRGPISAVSKLLMEL